MLQGISCDFYPGTFTAIIGPNGCGKTTLLRLLLGSLSPSRGTVHASGGLRPAFVPYAAEPIFAFSVAEVVAMSGATATSVERCLEKVGLASLATNTFAELSAGQRQRVLLARGLAQLEAKRARTLLADEPTASLDPNQAQAALATLRAAANEGAIVVAVMHDLLLARFFASHALLLNQRGTVAAWGPVAEVLTAANLESLYGVAFSNAQIEGMAIPTMRLASQHHP